MERGEVGRSRRSVGTSVAGVGSNPKRSANTPNTGANQINAIGRRLPNRRRSENFNFRCNDLAYTCAFSRFPNTDEIGELFLNNHRVNSHADVNARDAAVICSIALQHNVSIDTIRRALMRNASGPLGVALDAICGARHE
jgi:hypothetical protein